MQNQPLKVFHLISSRGLYGAERVVINLIADTDRDRFTSTLVLLRNKENPNIELLEAVREKQAKTYSIACRRWIDRKALRLLNQLIKEEGIDIVHCHELKGRLYGLLATKGTAARLITTNHNWIRSDFLVTCFEFLDAFYIRFFPRIIAVSPEVQQLMRRYLIPDKKMQMIINGIDMQEFRKDQTAGRKIRNELGIDAGSPLIGAFGRISPEKGQKYFIAAAVRVLAVFPEARFLIVGDGFQEEEMKQYAAGLGVLDQLVFAGFRQNIAAFYSALDVFVLPSLIEGTPMALLEAMAAELSVIASNVGGVGRIIQDGKNGMLVSPADEEELAAAVVRLLRNPAKAKNMAENALFTIAEKYSAKKMSAEYMKIYTEVVQGNNL